jgi:hypothetical protein
MAVFPGEGRYGAALLLDAELAITLLQVYFGGFFGVHEFFENIRHERNRVFVILSAVVDVARVDADSEFEARARVVALFDAE